MNFLAFAIFYQGYNLYYLGWVPLLALTIPFKENFRGYSLGYQPLGSVLWAATFYK